MGLCGDTPDPASEAQKAIFLDLELLPTRRQVEAAAARGEKVKIGNTEYDFTGLGEAEFQAKFADATAKTLLDIQRQYGDQYVTQRLAELQQADPEGFALRKDLYGRIKSSLDAARGGASQESGRAIQDKILAELERGGDLSTDEARRVEQAVLGKQVARGNFLGNAAATEEGGALVAASEARLAQRQQDALNFLVSGAAPGDVATRESQQAMQNLGSFIAGASPTAEFSQVAGAQNGAAPFYNFGPLGGTNPNAGAQGVSYALQTQAQQANPWLAGLQGLVGGLNIWGSLGGTFGGGGSGIQWAAQAPASGGGYGPN